MKRISICCCLLFLLGMTVHTEAQLRFSILGDSYSTYGGYVTPETNACWYAGTDGGTEKQNDVSCVEQTWWHLLTTQHDMQLDTNNSYSGSTICHTGYNEQDSRTARSSPAFIAWALLRYFSSSVVRTTAG